MVAVLDPAIDAALAGYRGYLKVFAGSPAAARLSPAAPVRSTGYDLDLIVAWRERVADDTIALTLRGEGPLPAWSPGAHVDVFLPSGAQRQYSLCGDPADRTAYRIAVRLIPDGGGGSRELHQWVDVGDRLTVRGPRQAFHLVPEPSYAFVAAGIGITPILPMVRAADDAGADWRLTYLGRSRESMPFLDELGAYADRVTTWTDDVHGAPDPARLVADVEVGTPVYMCGPTPLMTATKAALLDRDPSARFHSERFSPTPIRGGEEFTIRLARSGSEVTVGPDESALTAIRRVLPDLPYSCQQGFCGTCRLQVVDGDVDHFLPCVTRVSGTLEVDL